MADLSTVNVRLFFEECGCDRLLLVDPEHIRRQLLRALRNHGLPVTGSCTTGGENAETVTALLIPGAHVLVHTFPRRNRCVAADIFGRVEILDEVLLEIIRNLLNDLFNPLSCLSETGSGPALAERLLEEDAGLYLPGSLLVDQILESVQSPYQHIQVAETPGFGRVLVLDDIFQTSEKDEFLYHEPLIQVPLLAHPDPKQVLIIGGGDGGSAEEALKHQSVQRCTLVELDGEVIRMSRQYLAGIHRSVFDDERLCLRITDGRKFVAETKDRYDVLSLDLTDPDPQSDPLYSPEFFAGLHRLLTSDGLLTLHLGVINANPQHAKTVFASLCKVFPRIHPYFNYVPLYGGLMVFILAGNNAEPPTAAEIDGRIHQRRIEHLQFLTGATCAAMFAVPPYLKQFFGLA